MYHDVSMNSWLPEEMKLEGHEQIPLHVLQQSSFFTDPVSTKDDHSATANPVQLISQLCQPEDFCVFKLDINRSVTERELVDQLLEGPVSQGLLDEFFWKDQVEMPHFGLSGSGSLQQSYHRFLRLRNHGVRAHSWP